MMKINRSVFACLCCSLFSVAGAVSAFADVEAADFVASDPWIYRDDAAGAYRLYLLTSWKHPEGSGVEMRTSRDLVTWSEPKRVLDVPDARQCAAPWAPEMHAYGGKYYMFVTISTKEGAFPELKRLEPGDWKDYPRPPRGTWVYRADSPEGPFSEWSEGPIPPADWSTLDGTLFVEDGKPYMVFCHEWTQVRDGRMCAVEMTADLKAAVGKPFELFRAGNRPDAPQKATATHVTDGPFLFRSKNGSLLMTWSSGSPTGYCVLVSKSESGRLAGPWGWPARIFDADGGHGMLFRTFDGKLMMSLHQPNDPGSSKRLRILPLEDLGDTLAIAPAQGTSPLRFGVVSDVHVRGTWNTGKFEEALRHFDRAKVDAVMVCGDLADDGFVAELERFAAVWKRTFPNDCRSDGGKVEKLFVYGDHDTGGYAHVWEDYRQPKEFYGMTKEGADAALIPVHDRRKVWERVFGEPWRPVMEKRVKGFRFVLAHYSGGRSDADPEGLAEALAAIPANERFFYVQHRPVHGAVERLLGEHPNVLAFTGHLHENLANASSFSVAPFAHVSVPSLHNLKPPKDLPAGGHFYAPKPTQCLIVDVYPKETRLSRIDASDGSEIGPPFLKDSKEIIK